MSNIHEMEMEIINLKTRLGDMIYAVGSLAVGIDADLEHGVAWMNDEAHAKFAKDFPFLLEAISILKRMAESNEEVAIINHNKKKGKPNEVPEL